MKSLSVRFNDIFQVNLG